MKITTNYKGTIHLENKVIVSDPCYGLNTWCQGVVDNVLPGKYKCVSVYSDEGEWGTRIAAIMLMHKDYSEDFLVYNEMDFCVGVDSGQAGIFDYDYYKKYHKDSEEKDHVDEHWYDRVCDLTLEKKHNPNYVPFNWNENADIMKEYQRYKEWCADARKSMMYTTCNEANTIDNLGFVSSSGYGDGDYCCWTAHNNEGKIVAIRVEYITEDDEEDEDE